MKPRLVHVTTTDVSLDWLLRPQLEAFADAGYEVIAMSAPGPHVGALEGAGIRHVAVPSLTRAMAPLRDLRAFAELVARFRELRPDIVHTHNPKPGLLGRVAARVAGVPVVVNTVHGLYATPEDGPAKRTVVYGLERLAASCSDAELLQNPEDLPVLLRLGVPHSRLTVLGNGIDLDRFDPGAIGSGSRARMRAEWGIGVDTTVIGLVGRLVREKGYLSVFEAAARMVDDDCVFVVVGPDDPDKPGALSPAERAGAEAAGMRFLGPRSDMAELYAAFDVYLLASHREGFPRSAMEAAAMGLPVVATDIRGCRQVVSDGVTGALFAVDDVDGMIRHLRRLVAHPGQRARWGAAARAKALAHFDERTVVAMSLRTYDWLLSERVDPAVTLA